MIGTSPVAKTSPATSAADLPFAVCAALCDALLSQADRFNALDRAIGDGDHGNNLSRAAQALAGMVEELRPLPVAEALCRAGKSVVMSVGGASGPLYGSLLLDMGRALSETPALPDWAKAFSAGVAAVARRGRSAMGDKTMLDVLTPAAAALEQQVGNGARIAVAAMVGAARDGFDRSRALKALRGRAAYVGDRTIGHDDPGAASALLCIETAGRILLEYCE